jgi:hypothetical protein
LKILFLLIPLIVAPAFAQPISDMMGLKKNFDVVVDGKTFVIESVSNYDIQRINFEDNNLVFDIKSNLENNIGELQIPQNITKGVIHFYLDGKEVMPKTLQNDRITFVTLEFAGNGTHVLEVTSDYVKTTELTPEPSAETNQKFDQLTIVAAVAGIVIAIGIGSTVAFYVKRKSKS